MNAKTAMVASLAVLIALSLGMVVASDDSEATPSDAETIGEVMEFAYGDTYELGGKYLIFTEGGSLVFNQGSVLLVNSSTHLEGSGTVMILMPGSKVMSMGSLYVMTERVDVGLEGSMDFVFDINMATMSGSVSIDISDGGKLSMMNGITEGGPGKEVDVHVSAEGGDMAVTVRLNIPSISAELTSESIPSMFYDAALPFDAAYMEYSGIRMEAKAIIDEETQTILLTDVNGSGPSFIEIESARFSIPEMMEMSMKDMSMKLSLEMGDESLLTYAGLEIDSASVTMSNAESVIAADFQDLSTELRIVIGADRSISIDGGSEGEPFEVGVESVRLSLKQVLDGSEVSIDASMSDSRVLVHIGAMSGEAMPEASISLESESVSLNCSTVMDKVVTKVSASAQEFGACLEIGADTFGINVSLESVGFDLTANGSPLAMDAEAKGLSIDFSGTKAVMDGTISVENVSIDAQTPVGASAYQKRMMEFQGIEAKVSGSTFSSLKVASISVSGPDVIVDSITEKVTGLEVLVAETPIVSFDSYCAEVKGMDGSQGYVEATDVSTTSDGRINGHYVYALGHNTYGALNSLTFISSGIQVYDGMTVEFHDSYVGDIYMFGGKVEGTAYVCGDGFHTVSDLECSFIVDGDEGFDAVFEYEGSRIVSVEAVLCSDMYGENHYTEIEPYDSASGGIPYVIDEDGIANFTDLSGGTIRVSVGLATFVLTLNGTSTEYQYGTTVSVSASTSQEGMVFAGWYDGIQVALSGGDYYVRYDAEIKEIWAPADYDVVKIDGGLSIDIGDADVFYIDDVSMLLGARNIGPVLDLTVTNSIGSVTVDLEELESGSLMVMMSEIDQTPVSYINDAASGSKMYKMQASTLSPDGEATAVGSKISFDESSSVSGITSYGKRLDMVPTAGNQYQVGYDEDIVVFALGTSNGGSDSSVLIICVVAVILVVAIAAVVLIRRRNTV